MRDSKTIDRIGAKLKLSALVLVLAVAGKAATTGPTITAVQDAATYTAGVAEGSIFVVKGTNLSSSGFVQTSFPLPPSQDGVSIAFAPSAGGASTNAYIVYLYNKGGVNQLAAILPSTLPPGSYNVTVTNGGVASNAFATTVVKSKIGLITQDSSGAGLAVIQNYISASELDIDRFSVGTANGSFISPARPGQTLIAWATGIGPVDGGDNIASPGVNFLANGSGDKIEAIVGGVKITPEYAGRAPGLAGIDQINFALPSNVPTGCTVSFQVSVNGTLSNPTFVAIAPNGAETCVYPGLTAAQLQALDQGGTLAAGAFEVNRTISEVTLPAAGNNGVLSTAVGGFQQYTNFHLGEVPSIQVTTAANGACTVSVLNGGLPPAPNVPAVILDAGAITLTGPSGSGFSSGLPLTEFSNFSYGVTISLLLADGSSEIGVPDNGSVVPGTYTLTGAGGKSVGPFTVSSTLASPLFTLSAELPSTVDRSQPLTLHWTGGNSTDVVTIQGSAGTFTGTGANAIFSSAAFICNTTAGTGGITIPTSVLGQMPTVSAAVITAGAGSSSLSVSSGPNPVAFSPALLNGGTINLAGFYIAIGAASSPIYQ